MPDRMSFDIKRCSRRILWYLYFIMRKGSTQKACCDLLSSDDQIPVSLPVTIPFVVSLSKSVCRNNPLQFERIVIPPCALCWCCSPYSERTLQPCTTHSQTVGQPDGHQLLCHHYDCVIAHQQQPQQQHRAQPTTASTA